MTLTASDTAREAFHEASIPQWRRIELALRARVAGMAPGDDLASDADLCREFGVSRMTARNAMARLVDEGRIVRVSGRGTFVARPPAHRRADRPLAFSHEMRRRGRVPSSIVLARKVRPATAHESTALGLRPAEPVLLLRRVRLADGEPIALDTAVLIGAVAPFALEADVEHGSLHDALAKAGWRLRRGTATISAAAATAEDARLLGLRRGDPILVERRVLVDGPGHRVEAAESRYPADRYAIDVAFDLEPDADQEPR